MKRMISPLVLALSFKGRSGDTVVSYMLCVAEIGLSLCEIYYFETASLG